MSNLSVHEYAVFNSKETISRPEIEHVFALSQQRRKAIFILEGDRGAGKTTALLELFRRYLTDARFQPFFIGLAPYQASEFKNRENLYLKESDEIAIEEIPIILEKLAQYLNIRYEQMKDANIQREHLSRQLAQRRRAEKPAILVDSIYECEPGIRQQIESDILIPLLASNEVIIILSGRGKRPIWASPEFRNAEIVLLENFVQEKVAEQLQSMGSKHLDEVQKITQWSGGCPLVVRVLGKAAQVGLEALDKAINILIRDGLKPQYGSELDTLRPLIEKIALLQPFREVEVDRYLFGETDNTRSRTKDFVSKLIDSSLLAWDDKSSRRGYRLNKTVAHPVREWLFEEGNRYNQYRDTWQSAVTKLVKTYPSADQEEYLGMFETSHIP